MFRADRVDITVVMENQIDMLLPDLDPSGGGHHCVTRNGLIAHFDPKVTIPVAENGISLLVEAWRGRHSTKVLFDAGITGHAMEHNLAALGVDPAEIDHVVISHGHPDHYGGVHRVLELAGDRKTPVATHPDAFLPRYAVMGDGRTAPYYNHDFTAESLDVRGGPPVLTSEPLDLGWGLRTTGVIAREVSFEGPRPPAEPVGAPGLYQVGRDGTFGLDEVWDEQGLVVDVEGEGLVVLTGCAHAGVINTCRAAQAVHGDRPVRAVMGGFHLGFPTTPTENVDLTVEAFQEMGARMIMPMHCSGLRSHVAFSRAFPDAYVQPAVGTVVSIGG